MAMLPLWSMAMEPTKRFSVDAGVVKVPSW